MVRGLVRLELCQRSHHRSDSSPRPARTLSDSGNQESRRAGVAFLSCKFRCDSCRIESNRARRALFNGCDGRRVFRDDVADALPVRRASVAAKCSASGNCKRAARSGTGVGPSSSCDGGRVLSGARGKLAGLVFLPFGERVQPRFVLALRSLSVTATNALK